MFPLSFVLYLTVFHTSLVLAEVFTKLLLEANKNELFLYRLEHGQSYKIFQQCVCVKYLLENNRILEPPSLILTSQPAACKPGFSVCWLGALCSDSLVSMESASESASLGFSNISVAADQGIFMGFQMQ